MDRLLKEKGMSVEKYIDLLKTLPEDVQEKAQGCKTMEELLALLKAENVDLSSLKGTVELDDDDLDMVSGGCCEGSWDCYGM